MNTVIISGRLTKDVELNYTPAGMAITRFSVALDRGKDSNGDDRGTDFPTCKAFGKTAEMIERYTGKGCRIAIVGHIQTGDYTDRNGTKHYTTEVIVDRAEFIDWKSNQQNNQQSNQPAYDGFTQAESEIPF